MAFVANIQVTGDHRIPIGAPGEPITILVASGTVYYGDRQVSSLVNEGTLTAGQSTIVPAGQARYVTSLSLAVLTVSSVPALVSTTASTGHFGIPTCAGTPTGTPNLPAGSTPMMFDSTNSKLWVFSGTWKGVVVA